MINTLWTFTQLLCTAIITLGGAGAIIASVVRWCRNPDKERDDKLKKHGEALDRDNKRLRELEESNKIIMQSLLALMSHELDGNHTDALQKARDELQGYLISR
jgi:hypothetical protein